MWYVSRVKHGHIPRSFDSHKMPFNSTQSIPKELLKFRLDKQLSRLKQILNEPLQQIGEHEEIDIEIDLDVDDKYPEEDKFQLYQRILSWFIMGRLAKSEFDGIFEKLLNTSELIRKENIMLLSFCSLASFYLCRGS